MKPSVILRKSTYLSLLTVAGLVLAGLAYASVQDEPTRTQAMQEQHGQEEAGHAEQMHHSEQCSGMHEHSEEGMSGDRHRDGMHGEMEHGRDEMRGQMGHEQSQMHDGSRDHGDLDRLLENSEELGLNEDQVSRLREAWTSHQRDSIQREADIRLAELELEPLIQAPNADLAAVRAQMQQIASLRIAQRIAGMELHRTVQGILTPEQMNAVEGLHERHRSRAER